jgi:uncharacterized protein DUF3489
MKSKKANEKTLYALGDDNAVFAVDAISETKLDELTFRTEAELGKLASTWPVSRLAAIWNEMAGAVPFDDLKPVKKFTNRKIGVARIWKAIQRLAANAALPAGEETPKPKRSGKAATQTKKAATPRQNSKKAQVIKMLEAADGATLADIMKATNWQSHSVRGFISGSLVKKMGLKVESFKRENGERAYRIAS